MSLSFPSTSALNNIRPAAFQQLAQRGGQNGSDAGTYSSNGCALSFPNDTGAMTFTEMRDIFGVLLGKPKSGWQSETDSRRFLQSMDLASAYRGRTVEFFGDLVTDGIVNANDFLFNISPILETDEMTFDFYQRDSTMMPFTEIAACGVPEEIGTQGEHFTYTWTDRVKKYEQSAKIERDLALDSNFGMTYWLDILTQFIRNAILTMKMSIITTLVQVGYTNLTRNQQLGLPLDVHKLYMSESRGFLIMAEDPEAGINMVRDVLPRVKVNMIIGPANSSRYIAKAIGEPMPTRAERFVTDSVTGQAMVKFIEGPVSAKTISLGNGHQVDYIEFEPFVLDTQSTMPINPMRTRNTLGQFHPPNPLAKADDSVKSTTGDALDMGIFYQTKSIGREERITMAQRQLVESLKLLMHLRVISQRSARHPTLHRGIGILEIQTIVTMRISTRRQPIIVSHLWQTSSVRLICMICIHGDQSLLVLLTSRAITPIVSLFVLVTFICDRFQTTGSISLRDTWLPRRPRDWVSQTWRNDS
jgi:hypothetical protein